LYNPQPVEVEAVVSGQLPGWLSGSLVVNGGGDYSHMNHMFDGYGLLAKVRLQGGRAWGSQRYVDSKSYRAYKREGEKCWQQQQQEDEHEIGLRCWCAETW
jgi:carlactone synthase/all-trans-10'-apo-beta-carotenal 13,14-cleaving dioxygenase